MTFRIFVFLIAVFLIPAGGASLLEARPAKSGRAVEQKTKNISQPPMDVQLVRSAAPGCEPDCAEWISAEGLITADTVHAFKKVITRLEGRKVPVMLNSLGGSVPDSYAIGRLIRAKGLDVAVAQTTFVPCRRDGRECAGLKSDGVKLGLVDSVNAKCASACPFLLAAGTRRIVGKRAFVGVHEFASYRTTIRILRKYRITTNKSLFGPDKQTRTLLSEKKVGETTRRVETSTAAYAQARKYFAEMGVSERIMSLVHAASHDKLHVLTDEELKETRLATDSEPLETVLVATRANTAAKAAVATVKPNALGAPKPSDPRDKTQRPQGQTKAVIRAKR